LDHGMQLDPGEAMVLTDTGIRGTYYRALQIGRNLIEIDPVMPHRIARYPTGDHHVADRWGDDRVNYGHSERPQQDQRRNHTEAARPWPKPEPGPTSQARRCHRLRRLLSFACDHHRDYITW